MSNTVRPSFATLLDWVENRLPPAEAERVARYVAQAGDEVRAEVAWLRAFGAVSNAVQFAEPPPALHADLVQRFAQRAAPMPGLVRRVVAVLSYNSDQHSLPAGVRSAGADTAQRQYVYTTAQADVALNLVPHDETVTLYGQVLPKTVPANAVEVFLLHGGREVAVAHADEVGEWTFAAVTPGTYTLIINTGDVEIEVEAVAIHP